MSTNYSEVKARRYGVLQLRETTQKILDKHGTSNDRYSVAVVKVANARLKRINNELQSLDAILQKEAS